MLRAGTALVGLSLLLATQAAHAQVCDPGRAAIVLDRSGSMMQKKVKVGSVYKTRWEVAKTAIQTVTNTLETKAELGLRLFPENLYVAGNTTASKDHCAPGVEYVPLAMENAADIQSTIAANPPDMYGDLSNSFTPLGQTMENLGNDPDYAAGTPGRKFIILLSDGKQDCLHYDTGDTSAGWTTRGINGVKKLGENGTKTFVVGFATGGELDVYALNQMAYLGGTARPGCTPESSTINGKECFYYANGAEDLLEALTVIGIQISDEICDGKDNDCDGEIDGMDPLACGNAACPGTSVCLGEAGWSECDARDPSEESCSLPGDEDCDGVANEGCGCNPNDPPRPCGTDEGECVAGVQRCLPNGQYSDICEGEVGPKPEICDGKDNDCDMQIDEAERTPGDDFPINPCAGIGGGNTPPIDGGDAAACGCRVGGDSSTGSAGAGLFLLAGLAFLARRRRR